MNTRSYPQWAPQQERHCFSRFRDLERGAHSVYLTFPRWLLWLSILALCLKELFYNRLNRQAGFDFILNLWVFFFVINIEILSRNISFYLKRNNKRTGWIPTTLHGWHIKNILAEKPPLKIAGIVAQCITVLVFWFHYNYRKKASTPAVGSI
jgi:hypothetical protein